MGNKKVLGSQAGMATGIVMIIAVIMASLAMAILAMNRENNARDIRYALFHSMLDIVNINLYAFGQNDRAWKSTLAYNYSLSPKRMVCIQLGQLCDFTAKEDIVLRYPTNATTGSLYFDEAHLSTDSVHDGFRLDGSVCNYSDIANLNLTQIQDSGCILRVKVRWQPFCIANCRIGPDRMIFDLTYSTPKIDQLGHKFGSLLFYLPVAPDEDSGPMPIYNPYR